LFRAPRSRKALQDYLWFCMPHVREYNLAWDYYRGMGPAEIEDNLRADTSWQRPTWPLGRLGATGRFDAELLRDPLGVLRGEAPAARRTTPEPPRVPPELRAALDVLGLEWPVDATAARTRHDLDQRLLQALWGLRGEPHRQSWTVDAGRFRTPVRLD